MKFYGTLGDSGGLWGTLWDSMEFYGVLWDSMGLYGILWYLPSRVSKAGTPVISIDSVDSIGTMVHHSVVHRIHIIIIIIKTIAMQMELNLLKYGRLHIHYIFRKSF